MATLLEQTGSTVAGELLKHLPDPDEAEAWLGVMVGARVSRTGLYNLTRAPERVTNAHALAEQGFTGDTLVTLAEPAQFAAAQAWLSRDLGTTLVADLVVGAHHPDPETVQALAPSLPLADIATRLVDAKCTGVTLADFLDHGGQDLDHLLVLLQVADSRFGRLRSLSAGQFHDRELLQRLAAHKLTLRVYDSWTNHGVDDLDAMAMLEAHKVDESYYRAARSFGVGEVADICALHRESPSATLLWHWRELGLTGEQVVGCARARLDPEAYTTYRLLGINDLDAMLAEQGRGVSVGARQALAPFGVTDVDDVAWLLAQGLKLGALHRWRAMGFYHPLGILQLQRMKINPGVLEHIVDPFPEPPEARAEKWAALQASTVVRIRSGGRLIPLTPGPHGLVEPPTGERPAEEASERALLALGGERTRLLRVLDQWDMLMGTNNDPDTHVLPKKLRDRRYDAQRLWLRDQTWFARAAFPGCWTGRPDEH